MRSASAFNIRASSLSKSRCATCMACGNSKPGSRARYFQSAI